MGKRHKDAEGRSYTYIKGKTRGDGNAPDRPDGLDLYMTTERRTMARMFLYRCARQGLFDDVAPEKRFDLKSRMQNVLWEGAAAYWFLRAGDAQMARMSDIDEARKDAAKHANELRLRMEEIREAAADEYEFLADLYDAASSRPDGWEKERDARWWERPATTADIYRRPRDLIEDLITVEKLLQSTTPFLPKRPHKRPGHPWNRSGR